MSTPGATAIVGIGATKQGEIPDKTGNEIAGEAVKLALADAGMDKHQIDGLVTCQSARIGQGVDEDIGHLLGLNPKFSATLQYGTANFSLHLAAMAIEAGLASTVLLTYGVNHRSARLGFGQPIGGAKDMASLAGLVHVAGPAAMAFRRHQHLYGTTEEQLGAVAVAQREWAMMNPLAIFRTPMTIDDYLAAPYFVAPLRRHDFTMISDGGAAVILTRSDRAAQARPTPVYLHDIAEQSAFRADQNANGLMRPWIADLAAQLWRKSKYGHRDIDLFYVQEATSVWVLQTLEWFGFCGVGEGGRFISDGHTRPGGSLPVNTQGGQLSESYAWGWLQLCEAVRQLRGECGERQVADAEVALHCSTHDFLKGAVSILSTHPQ